VGIAIFEGVLKRQFKVGLILGGQEALNFDAGINDLRQFIGVHGVQVANQQVGLEPQALQMMETAIHCYQEIARQQVYLKASFGLTICEEYRAFVSLHQKTPSAGRVFFLVWLHIPPPALSGSGFSGRTVRPSQPCGSPC